MTKWLYPVINMMEYMIRKLIEVYKKWVLKLNLQNAKYLCVGGEPDDPTLSSDEIVWTLSISESFSSKLERTKKK